MNEGPATPAGPFFYSREWVSPPYVILNHALSAAAARGAARRTVLRRTVPTLAPPARAGVAPKGERREVQGGRCERSRRRSEAQ